MNNLSQKNLILFLPGFPGEAIPRQTGEVRVVDIISKIVRQKNLHFEAIRYPGITTDGSFTFENTKLHTLNVINDKVSQGYSITLIGQSWGGLLAILAVNQFKIDQLFLITPFLLSLPKDEIKNILKEYSSEFPEIMPLGSLEKNADDIQSIMTELTNSLKLSNQAEIRIFANIQDEVVSLKVIKELLLVSNFFKSRTSLTTSNNDHNFSRGSDDIKNWLINLMDRNLGTK